MDIETILPEPEPSSTMTPFSSIIREKPTLDILLSKEEKKINQITYLNAQIGAGTPTGAGTVIFKICLKKPAKKLATVVSNNSINYHDEVEALLPSLKVHYISPDSMVPTMSTYLVTALLQ